MEKTQKTKLAVIKIAGTQILVEEGKSYDVNKLEGVKGDKFVVDQVLLVSDGEKTTVGKPLVEGATVKCLLDSQKKGEKIDGFKFKAKARYRKAFGARPLVTRFVVEKIEF